MSTVPSATRRASSGPQGPSGFSHGYFATNGGCLPIGQNAYSQVAALGSVPDGIYMVSAGATFSTSNSAVDFDCKLRANGTDVPSTDAADNTTLTNGSNQVQLYCESGDGSTTARGSLSMLAVDALN